MEAAEHPYKFIFNCPNVPEMTFLPFQALENFPLLMYILAAKTLILCLAFAGVKMYQSKKIEEKLKREREEKLKAEAEKKDE